MNSQTPFMLPPSPRIGAVFGIDTRTADDPHDDDRTVPASGR